MWPAPDRTPLVRLLELQRRWQSEERAVSTVLAELETDLEEIQREVAFHRLLAEPRPLLEQRLTELRGECDALATELAHVRLALAGVRSELNRDHDWNRIDRARTPA